MSSNEPYAKVAPAGQWLYVVMLYNGPLYSMKYVIGSKRRALRVARRRVTRLARTLEHRRRSNPG